MLVLGDTMIFERIGGIYNEKNEKSNGPCFGRCYDIIDIDNCICG
jgi:hypothetical protein